MESPQSLTLGERARKGVFWVGFVTLGSKLLSVVTTLILARILVPQDYGLIGIAAVVISALTIFTDLGLGTAIIHNRGDLQKVASTAFVVMPLVGLVLFVVAFATAGLTASALGNTHATHIIQWLSINLFLSSLGVVPSALMEKAMAYRRKAIPDMVPILIYMITALTLAIAYHKGVYSIVFAQLAQSISSVILNWLVSGWRPSKSFDTKVAKELFHYGKHVLGGSVILYLTTNMDNIFVSRTNGAAALGFYTLAYSIANLPATHLGDVLGRVLFPSFVQLNKDPARLRRAYIRSLRVLVLVTYPILAGLAAVARPFTLVLLGGDKWGPMAPALMVLTLFTAARVLSGATGSLLLAVGRPKIIFTTGIAGLFLQAIFLVWFVVIGHHSFVGAAWAVSLASLLNGFFILFYVHKILGLGMWRSLKVGVFLMIPAALMGLLVFGLQARLPKTPTGLAVEVVVGMVSYVGFELAINGREPLRNLIGLIWRRKAVS